jgi:hypothetical protein
MHASQVDLASEDHGVSIQSLRQLLQGAECRIFSDRAPAGLVRLDERVPLAVRRECQANAARVRSACDA